MTRFLMRLSERTLNPLVAIFLIFTVVSASGIQNGEEVLDQARQLVEAHRADEAISLLNQAIQTGSPTQEHYLLLAKIQGQQEDAPAAIKTLREGLSRFSDNTLLLLELGDVLFRNGELGEAVEVFRRLSALSDSRGEREQMANALYLQGQAELARQNYFGSLVAAQKAVAVAGRAEYFTLLGSSYFNLGQNTDAAEAFKKAIELAPGDPRSYFNYGLVQLRQRDLDGAEQSIKHAVAIEPDFVEGLYYLGRIYSAKQQHLIALDYFKRAEELEPRIPDFFYQMGLVYKRLGQNSKAVEVLQKEVHINPESPSVRLELGLALTRTGQWTDARTQLEKALELNPDIAAAKFLLGKALTELDEPELALEYLKAAAEEEPTAKEPHYLLARVYWRLGDNEKAQEQIELYRQKNKLEKPLAHPIDQSP